MVSSGDPPTYGSTTTSRVLAIQRQVGAGSIGHLLQGQARYFMTRAGSTSPAVQDSRRACSLPVLHSGSAYREKGLGHVCVAAGHHVLAIHQLVNRVPLFACSSRPVNIFWWWFTRNEKVKISHDDGVI